MTRRLLACFIALVVPAVVYSAVGAAAGFVPSPMMWSQGLTYIMMGSLFPGSGVAAFLAARVARRGAPGLCSLVFPLIVAHDWWKVQDPVVIVLGIALCGALGVALGTMVASRKYANTRISEPAA